MEKRRDDSSFGQVRKDFKTVSDQLNSVGDDLCKANPFRDQAKPKKKTEEKPSFKTLMPIIIPGVAILILVILAAVFLN